MKRRDQNRKERKLGFEPLENRTLLSADGLMPFDGSAVLYQIHGNSGHQGQLSEINVADGSFTDLGPNAGFSINGVGYRTEDNFIYGMEMSNDHLIRLGADGSYERLGAIEGLPQGSYYTGDIGHDGLLYVRHGNTFYGIDVDEVAVKRTIDAPGASGIADVAYNPKTELYYAVRRQAGTTATADFISIDMREGADLGKVTTISTDFRPGGTYGAVFSDANGRVFASNNAGGLYEVNLETGEATFAGKTPAASSNDGAAPSNVAFNLPPTAQDAYVSTIAGATEVPLNIERPQDLEGDALSIRVDSLPNLGTVRLGANAISVGDSLTADELLQLVYDAPASFDGLADPGQMDFEVTAGGDTVQAKVEFELSGYSTLQGRVEIIDASDYGAWQGYAFDNQISLSGFDMEGRRVSQTTTTDLFGNFEFGGLLPGSYELQQSQPEDVHTGYATEGDLGYAADADSIRDITIATGSADRFGGFVFTDFAPSSVSGFVFIDENLDREVDAVEVGISEVTLRLEGESDLGDSVSLTTQTDQYGFYEFAGLRPGEYTVTQAQPLEYASVTELVGSEGGNASADTITLKLGAGVDAQSYSFAEVEAGSISGSVFIDNDIDTVFDGEDTGVADNRLQLSGADFLGQSVLATTMTNDSGDYRFDGLLPGTYTVTQLEQPEGLKDGRFAREHTNLNVASGEELQERSFDERLDLELARRFDGKIVLEATENNDIIDIVFGEEEHRITINGEDHFFAADRVLDFYLDALEGDDLVTMTGTDGVEQVRMWSDVTRFHSEEWRIHLTNGEDVTVDGGGGYDLAYLHGTAGNEKVKSTESYLRMEGDGFMNKAVGFHRGKAYGGGGEDDRAYFYDSKKDDTIKMRDSDARMFSRTFNNQAVGFDRVYAYANNGGTDHARMYDSRFSNDRFEATQGFARMYNQGRFYNAAYGFEIMAGYATNGGANDRVYLRDTAGDDTLVASPRVSGMTGDGYEITAEKFERAYAYASEGNDQAYLYDSKLNDRFIASPDNARLYSNRYYISASDFDQVDAYSSNGGQDRAYFHDSAGDDTLLALENEVRMYGEGFNNLSHGFSRAYVYGKSGGNDTAYLFDSDRADTVKTSRTNTRMYGPGYYTRVASQFETIEATFSSVNSRDRAIAFGVLDSAKVESLGGLATVMTEFGSSFIFDFDGLAELEEEDKQDDDGSVFAGLFPEDELFEIPSATA